MQQQRLNAAGTAFRNLCRAFHHLKLPFHYVGLKLSLLAMPFGQLIFGKVIKIAATGSQILTLSLNAPNSISAGAPPQTPLGSLQRFSRSTSWI